jgi:hypothetical protein
MKRYFLISILFLSAFVMFSCTGSYTEISGTWTKQGYTGKKFSNILVVAISDDVVKRNSVESAIVNELTANMIKSSVSANILDLGKIDKNKDGKIDTSKLDDVRKTLNEAGFDGAVVISLLDIKEETKYVPGQTYYQPNYFGGYNYGGFYHYSYGTYSVVTTPGYYVEKKNIFLETRLFDLKTEEMIWATKSETLNPSNLSDFSKSYAKALVSAVLNDNVLK